MKFIKLSPYILFLLLFALAGYFFLERIIYTDSAGMLFKLVNFKQLNVEASRYTAELPKLLPLLLTNLGVSLKWITFSFSVSYIILYFILYIISEYILKNKFSGLLIIFILTITTSYTFYHPVTETHQALIYCVVFHSLISSPFFNSKRITGLIISLILVAVSFFAHPIAVFPVFFIIGFHAISKKTFTDYRIYIIAIFLVLIAIIKVLSEDSTGYEGKLFGNITNIKSLYSNLINSYSLGWFLKRLSWSYLIHFIVFIYLISTYFMKREKGKLLLLITSIPGFLFFTFLAYQLGDNDTMLEKSFMPLNLLIGIPLFYEVKRLNAHKMKIYFFSIIILIFVNLGLVIIKSKDHTNRIATIEKVLDLMKANNYCKAIIDLDQAKHIGLGPAWAISNESLLVSKIRNNESMTFYVQYNPENIYEYSIMNNVYLYYPFYPFLNHNVINTDYFNFCDEQYYNITDLVKARFN